MRSHDYLAARDILQTAVLFEGSLEAKLPIISKDGKAPPGRSSDRVKIRREKIR